MGKGYGNRGPQELTEESTHSSLLSNMRKCEWGGHENAPHGCPATGAWLTDGPATVLLDPHRVPASAMLPAGCSQLVTEHSRNWCGPIPVRIRTPLTRALSSGTPHPSGQIFFKTTLQSGVLPTQSSFLPLLLYRCQNCILA